MLLYCFNDCEFNSLDCVIQPRINEMLKCAGMYRFLENNH